MAGRRVAFFGHAVVWAMVALLLWVTAGFFAAVVVALAWGIGLASHGYFAVLGPELRRRFTEAEVLRRVRSTVADERQVIENRHARSLEELSASIAHEIRNPVTAAKSLLQQMREDIGSPDNAEYARVALEELERVERAVSHLLRYAREEEMVPTDLDLAGVVHSAIDGLRDRIGKSSVRVEQDLDFDSRLRGDPEKLRRVVMNLVTNAMDALEGAGTRDPVVRIGCGRSLSGAEAWLKVRDNGPGIEPARLVKIWSPFHTSKKDGTGLGLAITKKIVEAHGGTIVVTSDATDGTEFVVTLPSQSEDGAE
jgi:two-component system sensor histidine kinase HydH